eukprot:1148254-Pelagomonas_calceolata.AAC.2
MHFCSLHRPCRRLAHCRAQRGTVLGGHQHAGRAQAPTAAQDGTKVLLHRHRHSEKDRRGTCAAQVKCDPRASDGWNGESDLAAAAPQ